MISASVNILNSYTPLPERSTDYGPDYVNKGWSNVGITITSYFSLSEITSLTTTMEHNNTNIDDRGYLLFDNGGYVWKIYNITKATTEVYKLRCVNVYPKFASNSSIMPVAFDNSLLCSVGPNGIVAPIRESSLNHSIYRSVMNYIATNDELSSSDSSNITFSDTNAPSEITNVEEALQYIFTNGVGGSTGTSGTRLLVLNQVKTEVNATNANSPSTIVYRDTAGNFAANEINAIASKAKYADYAERYTCKDKVFFGDIVSISKYDNYDIEFCRDELSNCVVGVVSEKPGYLINSECDGPAIARIGKVNAKVTGVVKKGDILVSAGNGCLRSIHNDFEISYKVALANATKTDSTVCLIEIIL